MNNNTNKYNNRKIEIMESIEIDNEILYSCILYLAEFAPESVEKMSRKIEKMAAESKENIEEFFNEKTSSYRMNEIVENLEQIYQESEELFDKYNSIHTAKIDYWVNKKYKNKLSKNWREKETIDLFDFWEDDDSVEALIYEIITERERIEFVKNQAYTASYAVILKSCMLVLEKYL